MKWIDKGNNLWKREKPPQFSARCLNFQALVGARLAQSVEHKGLNLVVVGSSPTVGVAAEPTQSLSSVNLQTMHPLKNAGTADWSCLGGFSDPSQTRPNISKRLLKNFFGKRSGAVASVLSP